MKDIEASWTGEAEASTTIANDVLSSNAVAYRIV